MKIESLLLCALSTLAACSNAPDTSIQNDSMASSETSITPAAAPDRNVIESVSTQPAEVVDAPDEPQYRAPDYDIATYCRSVGDAVGGSYMIEKGCRDQEETALTKIRSREIPQRVFNYCDQVAEAVGGSYMIFDGCVDQELGAAAEL